jgi:hypothetical protein
MKFIVLAAISLSLCAITACSSVDRAAHPDSGVIDLAQSKSWLSLTPAKRRAALIIRALDGVVVADQKAPLGMSLTPGPHVITLSVQRNLASKVGQKLGGRRGERLGQRLDSQAASRHDRQLSIIVQPGHDYRASMRSNGDSYDYSIKDLTTGETVVTTAL